MNIWPWSELARFAQLKDAFNNAQEVIGHLREEKDGAVAVARAATGEVIYLRQQNSFLTSALAEMAKPGVARALVNAQTPPPQKKEPVPADRRDVLPGI